MEILLKMTVFDMVVFIILVVVVSSYVLSQIQKEHDSSSIIWAILGFIGILIIIIGLAELAQWYFKIDSGFFHFSIEGFKNIFK